MDSLGRSTRGMLGQETAISQQGPCSWAAPTAGASHPRDQFFGPPCCPQRTFRFKCPHQRTEILLPAMMHRPTSASHLPWRPSWQGQAH